MYIFVARVPSFIININESKAYLSWAARQSVSQLSFYPFQRNGLPNLYHDLRRTSRAPIDTSNFEVMFAPILIYCNTYLASTISKVIWSRLFFFFRFQRNDLPNIYDDLHRASSRHEDLLIFSTCDVCPYSVLLHYLASSNIILQWASLKGTSKYLIDPK